MPRIPRNPRQTAIQMQNTQGAMAERWKPSKTAGTRDRDLNFVGQGGHTCAARAIVIDQGGVEVSCPGEFKSRKYHAEMAALEKVITDGYSLDDIVRIEIESSPCPRCAVVLNRLNLAGLVTYKSKAAKDQYPTWTYPEIGRDWNEVMGINNGVAAHADDKEELLVFFHTQEWWNW